MTLSIEEKIGLAAMKTHIAKRDGLITMAMTEENRVVRKFILSDIEKEFCWLDNNRKSLKSEKEEPEHFEDLIQLWC